MSAVAEPGAGRVTGARHARAIALLPLMNTVLIPSTLLAIWPVTPSWPTSPQAWATTLAGALLMIGGATLVAHCIALFVRLGRGTLAPWDQTNALVTAGAYGYSRNPMKGGLFLVLAGEALLTQSPALAIWFAGFAAVNVLYIRLHEEPGLARRFGARYTDYSARVRRWWPALNAGRSKENS